MSRASSKPGKSIGRAFTDDEEGYSDGDGVSDPSKLPEMNDADLADARSWLVTGERSFVFYGVFGTGYTRYKRRVSLLSTVGGGVWSGGRASTVGRASIDNEEDYSDGDGMSTTAKLPCT
jgi:hypothetical protein